jgi:hypothetical protein
MGRSRTAVAPIGGAQAPGQQLHHLHGEIGHFPGQADECRPVEDDQFGRLARDRGSTARGPVDERHLAEQATGSDDLEDLSGAADFDLAGAHEIGVLAAVALDEDDAAIGEADGPWLGPDGQIDIESEIAHVFAPTPGPRAVDPCHEQA